MQWVVDGVVWAGVRLGLGLERQDVELRACGICDWLDTRDCTVYAAMRLPLPLLLLWEAQHLMGQSQFSLCWSLDTRLDYDFVLVSTVLYL